MRYSAIVLALWVVAAIPASSALATEQETSPDEDALICLTATTKGAAGQRSFTVMARGKYAGELEERGFTQVPCNGNVVKRTDFAQRVCGMAKTMAASSQENFKSIYSVSPAELCAMAGG